MTILKIDLTKTAGKIKPMNAVNNGPIGGKTRNNGNFQLYKEAEIPYARNHDAAFCADYGSEFSVDIHNIFRNFDADENDPSSYIFTATDEYVKTTADAGTETFYRLGSKIEHGFKFGTYPPKDFAKWARICEHIIRHYNEGWADGFTYNIKYWEIWNEPDCQNADGSFPCWQGTEEQFIDLYEITAKHLKKCFPNLKIGGPAFCGPWRNDFKRGFLKAVKEREIPLDFYSYHCYAKEPIGIGEAVIEAENALSEYGLDGTFTILDEWNYVKCWLGDDWRYTLIQEKGIKGAAFIAGTMSICQNTSLGMLMYYDARPCGMNGLFNAYTYEPLKGYYSFLMFRELRRLGIHLPTEKYVDDIYSCAATDGSNSAIMLTHFNDDDNTPAKEVKLEIAGNMNNAKLEYYLLDETHNLELVREEVVTAERFASYLKMDNYTNILIKIKPMQ